MDNLEKILEGIRTRWNDRRNYINNNIDIIEKCGIINTDAKDRSHGKSQSSGQKGVWRRTEKNNQPILIDPDANEVVGGNAYSVVAAKGGDPSDPKEVQKAKNEIKESIETGGKKTREKPNIAKDLVASEQKPFDAPLINSKYGENEYAVGFMTKKMLDSHYQYHVLEKKEFGNITKEEYVRKAVEFSACGASGERLEDGDVVGYMYSDEDGNDIVVRFNQKTGEYSKMVPGWKVITYFKAKIDMSSGKVMKNAALKYYIDNYEKDLKKRY